MPLSRVTLDSKDTIMEIVSLHHVLLNSKAEIDQFLTGLSALGVLAAMKANPELFESFFSMGSSSTPIAGSAYIYTYSKV